MHSECLTRFISQEPGALDRLLRQKVGVRRKFTGNALEIDPCGGKWWTGGEGGAALPWSCRRGLCRPHWEPGRPFNSISSRGKGTRLWHPSPRHSPLSRLPSVSGCQMPLGRGVTLGEAISQQLRSILMQSISLAVGDGLHEYWMGPSGYPTTAVSTDISPLFIEESRGLRT